MYPHTCRRVIKKKNEWQIVFTDLYCAIAIVGMKMKKIKQLRIQEQGQRTPLLFSTPLIVCLVVFMILPFLLTIILSFTNFSLQQINNPNRVIKFVGLKNYIGIWENGRLLKVVGRTYVWMVGSVVLGLVFGCFYAVVMTFKIKGRNFLKAVILMPWVLPSVVTGYVMKLIFSSGYGVLWSLMVRMGLLAPNEPLLSNPKAAMVLIIIANTWRAAPYVAIMIYGKLASLPQSHLEAASIDGANAWQSFINITIPWLWPIIKRCGLLLFMWSFNAYAIIYTMTNGGPANATTILPIALRNVAFGQYAFGKGAAYGVVILLLIVLTYLVAEALVKLVLALIRRRKTA